MKNKTLNKEHIGGYVVTLNEKTLYVTSQKEGYLSFKMGVGHPLHAAVFYFMQNDKKDDFLKKLHAMISTLHLASEALWIGTFLHKLAMLVDETAKEQLKKQAKTTEEEDAVNLEFVKGVYNKMEENEK